MTDSHSVCEPDRGLQKEVNEIYLCGNGERNQVISQELALSIPAADAPTDWLSDWVLKLISPRQTSSWVC